MAILTAGSHRIYYETAGQGQVPLLLLNGLAMNTFAWSFLLPYLAPYYRVVLLDFLGQGQSDKPEQDCYELFAQADLAAAVLDELAIARAHVVGLSYGGMVAQHFAHRHGERVDRLVLASTLAWSDTVNCHIIDSWRAAHEAGGFDLRFTVSLPWLFSSRGLEAQAGFLPELKKIGAQVDWPALLRLMGGVRGHDARAWLASLSCPAIVLVGEEDRLTPLYQGALLAGGIPDAELIELPQIGHALHVEAPEAFAREILRFCPYQ